MNQQKTVKTEKEKPLLSIVVLCYKVEKFLPQCLESIRNQTFRDFEVIMVDDGSPDGSGKICDDFAKSDERFRVIHRENGGIIAARKTGLNAARGVWCGAVDGDDWIEPDMYERMVGAALKYGVDFVQCSETLRFADKDEPEKLREKKLYDRESLLEGYRTQAAGKGSVLEVSLCRVILKTDRLRTIINQLDESCGLCEDAVCLVLYASESDSMYETGAPLYNYRMREGSCTNVKETRELEGLYKLYEFTESKLVDCPFKEDLLKWQAWYFIRHSMATVAMNIRALGEDNGKGYVEKEISNPRFQRILSRIPVSEYPLFFTKSMVECFVFKKVPYRWNEENLLDIDRVNLFS